MEANQAIIKRTFAYLWISGQKNWYKKYPDCGGTEQSPIDIVTEDVECDASLTDFTYHGYDTSQTSPFLIFEVNDFWQAGEL